MSQNNFTNSVAPSSILCAAFAGVVIGANIGTLKKAFARIFYSTVKHDSSKDHTLSLRSKYFCDAQSISYKNTEPLMALKASMQYIFDERGNRFLDTRNNVGHVGWQHPHVVSAIQEQVSLCNANTRYIHPKRTRLAERLLKYFPERLSVVFFVNSGSEANDLALRLAREYSGNEDAIVLDRAYHGNTIATLSLSPYKFEHKGGERYKKSWVHKVKCPDCYRENIPQNGVGEHFALEVKAACRKSSAGRGGVAAFFVESGMSVAGVILPPRNYLKSAYRHVREAGGVCVADEVQTGFGRFGESFWGFEQQDVIPDIVTMGKPFGNGFPLAAVVTTKAIAQKFTNGLEYFNTFGGNPVACAAGLAVLDVLEQNGMQAKAKETGDYLKKRVVAAMHEPGGEFIGDVRGSGLFVGIEFVRNRETREPATKELSLLCSLLKAPPNRILTSIDGTYDNVMVIKPPMCFTKENVDTLMDAMLLILRHIASIPSQELEGFVPTPT